MASPLLRTCRLHRADPCEKQRLFGSNCSNNRQSQQRRIAQPSSASHLQLQPLVAYGDLDSGNRVDALDGGVAKMTSGNLKEPHRTLHVQIPATPSMLSGTAVRPFNAVG
ncbi:hypothetical protein LTR02_004374 [Friedmanniomyces endolithicus]|nr:hypothetical protein LTS09_000650 [Friedmanniomyces endolithicus]KAK0848194.1 hypothetical protein LTR03_005877 [Friedmanniomyces endolithicus]KAK0909510.1 hypothetical protein LTR02_004374 [Friedmanniomyces endolithicus]KAK0919500.1 hypothetical protein LTR57_010697 [Friedmanniomyces endolithicus]